MQQIVNSMMISTVLRLTCAVFALNGAAAHNELEAGQVLSAVFVHWDLDNILKMCVSFFTQLKTAMSNWYEQEDVGGVSMPVSKKQGVETQLCVVCCRIEYLIRAKPN